MKNILVILSIFIVSSTCYALDIDPFKGPKPIVVLIQTDPWLMVMGSDTPMLAIYEDGQVVSLQKEEHEMPVFLHAQLSSELLADIKKKILSFGDYSKLKHHYDIAPNAYDLPETKIYLSLDEKPIVTSVYGLMVSDTQLPAYGSFSGMLKPDDLPQMLKDLHSYLASLSFSEAKPWDPSYVEVMIWDYGHAPEESIHWPKDWPGLKSPNTLKRGDAYSIFLPGTEFPKLCDFLKTRKEKGAVEIDGRKWTVSARYPFPNEPIWAKAFRENE